MGRLCSLGQCHRCSGNLHSLSAHTSSVSVTSNTWRPRKKIKILMSDINIHSLLKTSIKHWCTWQWRMRATVLLWIHYRGEHRQKSQWLVHSECQVSLLLCWLITALIGGSVRCIYKRLWLCLVLLRKTSWTVSALGLGWWLKLNRAQFFSSENGNNNNKAHKSYEDFMRLIHVDSVAILVIEKLSVMIIVHITCPLFLSALERNTFLYFADAHRG